MLLSYTTMYTGPSAEAAGEEATTPVVPKCHSWSFARNRRRRIDQLRRHVVRSIDFALDQLKITAIDLGFFLRVPQPLPAGSARSARMKVRRKRGPTFAVAFVAAGGGSITGMYGPKNAQTEPSNKSLEWR